MSTEINFIEIDSQKTENELIDNFQQIFGQTLYSSDERRIFLLQELPIILGLKNSINNSARQNLLRYASDEILDAMGEFYNCIRLPAQKATVTIRFTLSAVQINAITIPAGKRVTPDGVLYFETKQDLIIPAGNLVGDVISEAVDPGIKFNNFAVGTIKNLVDPVPYVASVINTETSQGGADGETDDAYRERIRIAPESFSTAGPSGGYVYWAKTADSNIIDVSVDSPSPGTVRIIPLMTGGTIPAQSILDKVLAITSAKDKRPLTDNVQLSAPTQVSYDITFTYYISKDNQATESSIKSVVDSAVINYQSWQCSNLGKAINPDYLRQFVLNAGASRLTLTSPAYQTLTNDKVAKIGTISVTYGGLE